MTVWNFLILVMVLGGIIGWLYSAVTQRTSILVFSVLLMIGPILVLHIESGYRRKAKETAPFTTQEASIQETTNGMQYVEYRDEIINVNEYFGKSFEVGQEIYVNEYEENSYGGANSAPYWKLVDNLEPESRNAN